MVQAQNANELAQTLIERIDDSEGTYDSGLGVREVRIAGVDGDRLMRLAKQDPKHIRRVTDPSKPTVMPRTVYHGRLANGYWWNLVRSQDGGAWMLRWFTGRLGIGWTPGHQSPGYAP